MLTLGQGTPPGQGEPSAGSAHGLTEVQAALRALTLASVPAAHTRRAYGKALDDLFLYAAGRPLTRALLMEFRGSMDSMDSLATPTINLRLSAVRKMVVEAARNGWLRPEEAARLISAVQNGDPCDGRSTRSHCGSQLRSQRKTRSRRH